MLSLYKAEPTRENRIALINLHLERERQDKLRFEIVKIDACRNLQVAKEVTESIEAPNYKARAWFEIYKKEPTSFHKEQLQHTLNETRQSSPHGFSSQVFDEIEPHLDIDAAFEYAKTIARPERQVEALLAIYKLQPADEIVQRINDVLSDDDLIRFTRAHILGLVAEGIPTMENIQRAKNFINPFQSGNAFDYHLRGYRREYELYKLVRIETTHDIEEAKKTAALIYGSAEFSVTGYFNIYVNQTRAYLEIFKQEQTEENYQKVIDTLKYFLKRSTERARIYCKLFEILGTRDAYDRALMAIEPLSAADQIEMLLKLAAALPTAY